VNQPDHSELEPLSRTQILVIMGMTALILAVIAKIWQKIGSVQMLAWSITPKAILAGLALAVVISLASSLIYFVWPAYRRSAYAYLQLVVKPLTWSDLIWLGLLPGLSEELLFRGVMLPAFGLNLAAVIISSFIFGILHTSSAQQWSYAIWATLIGFFLGYAALITNNLIVPIVAHIATNLFSGIFWKTKLNSNISSS